MKNIAAPLLIAFFLIISIAQAQSDSVRTLMNEGENVTFFTGPFLRNKWFENSSVVNAFGGGAGFYFQHKYYIYLQTTSFPIEFGSGNSNKYNMNALGVSIGYCFNPKGVFHFVTGSQIYSAVVTNNKDINPDNNIKLNYLLLAPELYIELNLVSYVRIYAGPSYYITIGNDSYNWINNKFINGFSFNLGLLVGKF
jgi:hypothetical protein